MTTSAASSSVSSAYNYFLTMLTTELKTQNPLDPVDSTQFCSQLIELSSVEELVSMNSCMSDITSDLSSLSLSSSVSYIGKTVEASGSTAALQSDSAEWSYTLSSTAATTTLTITDSSGDAVWTGTGDTDSGSHTLTWDGQTTSGTQLTSGTYTLTVSATDSSGSSVTTSTDIIGQVTGVDSSSGTTELEIGGVLVPLSSVTRVTSS
jgi:flagellar basal-body rod modification protein FlgD